MKTRETTPNIVALHVVDYGAQGEYGFFGKTVCKSDTTGFSQLQIDIERNYLRTLYGYQVSILEVEEIPAVSQHNNEIAQEGCDRCFCGCKYWEHDRCVDCGTHVREVQ